MQTGKKTGPRRVEGTEEETDQEREVEIDPERENMTEPKTEPGIKRMTGLFTFQI